MNRRCSNCGRYKQVTKDDVFVDHAIDDLASNPVVCAGSGQRVHAKKIGFAVVIEEVADIVTIRPERQMKNGGLYG